MAEQAKINKLSDMYPTGDHRGNAIVMVGSFAPIHRGHFDAIRAASMAVVERGSFVGSLIFAPNSPEYMQRKFHGNQDGWTYGRRVQEILDQDPDPCIPTYVDDVSGRIVKFGEINDYVVPMIRRHLGFAACQTYLVVGFDRLLSMESHLRDETNQAICVLRPGSLDDVQKRLEIPWVAAAVESERFIIIEREDMETDISSTAIRDASSSRLTPELLH